jgi:hypothetical protein
MKAIHLAAMWGDLKKRIFTHVKVQSVLIPQVLAAVVAGKALYGEFTVKVRHPARPISGRSIGRSLRREV